MKVIREEISKNNERKRLVFACNKEELDIIHGLVQLAIRHTPHTIENDIFYNRMRNISSVIGRYKVKEFRTQKDKEQ